MMNMQNLLAGLRVITNNSISHRSYGNTYTGGEYMFDSYHINLVSTSVLIISYICNRLYPHCTDHSPTHRQAHIYYHGITSFHWLHLHCSGLSVTWPITTDRRITWEPHLLSTVDIPLPHLGVDHSLHLWIMKSCELTIDHEKNDIIKAMKIL